MAFNPLVAANLLGTGLDFLGAREDRKSQEDLNSQNRDLQREMTAKNIALQREFAQHGIRWKVEDAKAAGVHPLYALGAQGASFSPVSVMDAGVPVSKGNEFRAMGQGISRAVNAAVTREERVRNNLVTERMVLENELLRSQISSVNRTNNPPLPSNSEMPLLTGQGDSHRTATPAPYVREHPLDRVHSQPGRPAQDVGAITDYSYVRTPTGYAVVPSADVKQRIEDQIIPEIQWSIRNQLVPFFKGHPPPNPKYYPPPKGYVGWRWDWQSQEYRPTKELRFKMRGK